MEHLIITPMANGKVRITPEEGYLLKNKVSGQIHSEAIVKDTRNFIAVAVE